jgi:hypothetical protein
MVICRQKMLPSLRDLAIQYKIHNLPKVHNVGRTRRRARASTATVETLHATSVHWNVIYHEPL